MLFHEQRSARGTRHGPQQAHMVRKRHYPCPQNVCRREINVLSVQTHYESRVRCSVTVQLKILPRIMPQSGKYEIFMQFDLHPSSGTTSCSTSNPFISRSLCISGHCKRREVVESAIIDSAAAVDLKVGETWIEWLA
jgi:hypothetical protein